MHQTIPHQSTPVWVSAVHVLNWPHGSVHGAAKRAYEPNCTEPRHHYIEAARLPEVNGSEAELDEDWDKIL